jgi:hypothetical protein
METARRFSFMSSHNENRLGTGTAEAVRRKERNGRAQAL